MPKRRPFSIEFTDDAAGQLELIEPRYLSVLEAAVSRQLKFEPFVKTRNRKPLTRPTRFGQIWELRCGESNEFCLLYKPEPIAGVEMAQIASAASHVVLIVSVLTKRGNRFYAGAQEFEL